MPTSGTCRPTEDGCRARQGRPRGFTLLEIIVVLAIMGLVAAVATPAVVRGIDSWRRQAQVDAVLDQLRGLPARARASGRAIALSDAVLATPDAPLSVEGDWTLAVPEPWQVHANGVCDDGAVELRGAGRVVVIEVRAPFCDASVPVGD